jgi:phosphoglycerate dehydrogenase-like enzyme
MDATRELLSAERLGWMKSSAVLVNIARGELVDERALVAALKEKRIAGAAVDVFATEPPQESPLLRMDNVLATPHIGAYTVEAMEAMGARCAETILETLAGRYPENVLNRDALRPSASS